MAYLQRETFVTPTWMIDQNILRKIEHAGAVERIRNAQVNTLNQLLDPSRLARLIEAEAMLGKQTYTPLELFSDIRTGLWSELTSAKVIDTYRRNLQRAHIERLEFLMKEELPPPAANIRAFTGYTAIDVSQSDIRPIARGELKALRSQLTQVLSRTTDTITRYHLDDCIQRINLILDPK